MAEITNPIARRNGEAPKMIEGTKKVAINRLLAKHLGWSLALVAVVSLSGKPAEAKDYPSRTITIITPFAAGSVTDATARIIGKYIQKSLNVAVVIENRDGAGGMVAAQAVARAAPDGYTLILATSATHSSAPALFKSIPYDPIKDFTAIARVASIPSIIIAGRKSDIKTMQELVVAAKERPGKLSYGFGNAVGRIAGDAIRERLGLDMVGVPFRSVPAGYSNLLGGQIDLMIPDLFTALPQIRENNVFPLAVLTKERNKLLPDVPTLSEAVMPGFDLIAWAGLFGPANLPPEVVAIIAKQVEDALKTDEIKEHFAKSGTEQYWASSNEFKEFVRTELSKWATLIQEAKIKPE
jgi:tripartite-type tricarboxylate transporter receptor subunit TctC